MLSDIILYLLKISYMNYKSKQPSINAEIETMKNGSDFEYFKQNLGFLLRFFNVFEILSVSEKYLDLHYH